MDDIERLLIERACERLIVDYTHFVDFGAAARIAELFTEDGEWHGPDLTMTGRSGIREGFERRQGVTRRVSRHVCTNVAIDVVSADEATGLCYLVNFRHDRREGDDWSAPAPAGLPKYVGEYRDRFVRTPQGWRFAHRRFDLAYLRP
jgi:hypothetical protein